MNKVHFIGIGGTGISAIARVLLERGIQVSGTDMHASPYFETVTSLGALTRLGHHPDLAVQADLVVRSSAVKDDDPEVQAARKAGIPVLKRSEFLPQLTSGFKTLAIAGSHGKTTTTAMLVHLLRSANLDPTFILGADIKGMHTNAHAGKDELFVIEADEYDYMFLGLNPFISIVTNIEYDHPDFFITPQIYTNAFVDFLNRTEENGTVLLNGDDAGIQEMLTSNQFSSRQIKKYGFESGNDYQIVNYESSQGVQKFSLSLPDGKLAGPFTLHLPGKYNVGNAAAAFAVAHLLGIDLVNISDSFDTFEGTSRRFDLVCQSENVKIYNDYGHHPSQLVQTIQGARESYPDYKIWAVWEPHTVSRTRRLQHEFAKALVLADYAVILKLFGAREEDSGYSPCSIAEESGSNCIYQPDNDKAVNYIVSNLTGKNLVIVFSAGKGPDFSQALCSTLHLEEKK
ncbi:MAG: UDP-N-acetylmuramate--L-alanine ligase [Anaerolineaceae bacterium]|jgi:UDP-N-acetylmuramate--alanine ligase